MNIPNKYLQNNNLSNEKILFYQKLASKYTMAFTKYHKKYQNLSNYKSNIYEWFFSLDLETRMIVCSIENKKFTNALGQAFLMHEKDKTSKFFISEKEESDNNNNSNEKTVSVFYHREDSNTNNNISVKEESFLNHIIFYQSESQIENLEMYSNYFTLNKDILENQEYFKIFFEQISKNKCFSKPIKTSHDASTKVSVINLPDWLNPSINNSEKNQNKYYTIGEYFIGLFEQAISVRYILMFNSKNLNEIFSGSFLKEIFEREKLMIKYLKNLEPNKYFFHFKIDELVKKLFNNEQLENFINKKSDKENNDYNGWFASRLYFNKTVSLDENIKNVNNFLSQVSRNGEEEFIKHFLFIHIKKLFTYDDFLYRGISEAIYNDYTQRIADDLLNNKESSFIDDVNKKKKKKKKKKGKKNNLENNNNFSKEIVENFVYFLFKKVFEKIDENKKNVILIQKLENFNIDNSKKINENNKKKIKEKKFFLYETTKKKKKSSPKKNEINLNLDISKQIIQNNLNNLNFITSSNSTKTSSTRSDSHNHNNKKEEISFTSYNNNIKNKNNNFKKNSNLNFYNSSFFITPNNKNNINNNSNNNNINNNSNNNNNNVNNNNNKSTKNLNSNNNEIEILINHNPMMKFFDSFNNDIKEYINEQEEFLSYLRQIKFLIRDYLNEITNKLYSNSVLEIYGSCLYQLDIESSDLDLSIITKDKNINLSPLIIELTELNKENEIFIEIVPILSATVPLIKLIIDPLKLNNNKINSIYDIIQNSIYYKNYIFDKKEINQIKVDISINSINSHQIIFMQNSLKIYPEMIPVIKILKRILQETNMNVTYKGGISSYCLFLLIYAYLKYNSNIKITYCILLINFLVYYGMVFDFEHIIINTTLNNPFIRCYNLENVPSILDPITQNNAGKNIYRIFDVTSVFRKIYKNICILNNEYSILEQQNKKDENFDEISTSNSEITENKVKVLFKMFFTSV